jgi:hypothetical protein
MSSKRGRPLEGPSVQSVRKYMDATETLLLRFTYEPERRVDG